MQTFAWLALIAGVLVMVKMVRDAACHGKVHWFVAGCRGVVFAMMGMSLHNIVMYLCAEFELLLFCPAFDPMTLWFVFAACVYGYWREIAKILTFIIALWRNKKQPPIPKPTPNFLLND